MGPCRTSGLWFSNDAKDLDGLQSAFEMAVAHYIDFCKSEGWDPKAGMPEPALKAKRAQARRYA